MVAMLDLYGFKVHVYFLVSNDVILAYGWHYEPNKALAHLNKIIEYHGLEGDITQSRVYEDWLKNQLDKTVLEGMVFKMPNVGYRDMNIYLKLLEVRRGETITYSELARRAGVRYTRVLTALLKNPFQILIPCHRLVTSKGTLMGFHPLGIRVKRRLLELEGSIEH